LGSGFRNAFADATVQTELPFSSIPGFASPSVPGHEGRLLIVSVASVPVLVLNGRAHFYEGHPMEAVTFPVRVLAELGVRHLMLTNAAGGIHRSLRPGDFMSIKDHINLMGSNPLRGEGSWDGRGFVDLTTVYDCELRKLVRQAGSRAGLTVREGVYLAVAGPSYETPAEIRAFAKLGADAVGMSTVPEAIVARQCGLAVAGLSCITNLAAGRSKGALSHQEVLAIGKQVRHEAAALIKHFIQLYAQAQP
jgi:purine-nucleoside phosphorylase